MFNRRHKNRKTHLYGLFIGAAIVTISILFLNFDRHNARGSIYQAIDSFESLDLGISGIPGLYGRSHIIDMADSWLGIFSVLAKEFPQKVLFRIPIFFDNFLLTQGAHKNIETLRLDVKFKDWEKLESNRNIALRKTRLLIQRDKVKVKGQYQDAVIKGKLRLKGDFSDHWRSNRRMSLHIELSKKSNSVKGFRRFNLHKPAARQYPYEQIFQKLMNDIDIASVQHNYIHVFVNGVDWGIMNIQETYSKELLEKQKRKDSLIIKLGDETDQWKITSKFGNNTGYQGGSPKITSNVFKRVEILRSRVKRKQFSYIIKRLEEENLHGIVDIEKFSNMALLALIWGDSHVTRTSNSRYYLNPYTIQLEPLSSDQSQFKKIQPDSLTSPKFPQVYKYALNNIIKKGKFFSTLDNLLPVIKKAEYHGDAIKSYFPNDFPIDYDILLNNFSILKNKGVGEVLDVDDYMSKKRGGLTNLNEQEWSEAENFVTIRHYESGRIRVFNHLPVSIILKKIIFEGVNVLSENVTIKGASIDAEKVSSVDIFTDIQGIQDSKITAVSSLGNINKETLNNITHTEDNYNPLDNYDITHTLPSFLIKKQGGYEIKTGSWIVKKPLVIHGDLTVNPSTTIMFSKNSYLIIKGNVIIKGKKDSPIIFKGLNSNSKWKGIYVLGNKEKSLIKNLIIRNATSLSDGILDLSGSINIYNSNITIDGLTIDNTTSEDAINIVNSKFSINNISVFNTPSDAIDIDFSNGKITNSTIKSSKGDALDFSGSNIELNNIFISNIKDKGLSAGENSKVNGSSIFFNNVGVGIASKDGSNTKIKNSSIKNFILAGVMTYVKKDFYTTPTLRLINTSISSNTSNDDFLRQKKTYLYIDDNLAKETDLDVNALYQTKVMKK